jgi:hypothetical protein
MVRTATVVENPVQCRVKTIVGAGKHPEQFLPPEVNLACGIRINAEPITVKTEYN